MNPKERAYEGLFEVLWPPHPMTAAELTDWLHARVEATGVTAQEAVDGLAAFASAIAKAKGER